MTDSARKQELLEAAYQHVLGYGLADMSLRPLAKEIGSSPRVLLFLFGSKEGLIRALLGRAREEELRYLEKLRGEHNGLAVTGRDVWAWLADPSHRPLLALWVEGYARSLLGEPGPWAEFGRDTVRDWLDLLAERQAADTDAPDAEAQRTLLLAVLRGALLDLLATGDTDRVTRAVDRHLRTVGHRALAYARSTWVLSRSGRAGTTSPQVSSLVWSRCGGSSQSRRSCLLPERRGGCMSCSPGYRVSSPPLSASLARSCSTGTGTRSRSPRPGGRYCPGRGPRSPPRRPPPTRSRRPRRGCVAPCRSGR